MGWKKQFFNASLKKIFGSFSVGLKPLMAEKAHTTWD